MKGVSGDHSIIRNKNQDLLCIMQQQQGIGL